VLSFPLDPDDPDSIAAPMDRPIPELPGVEHSFVDAGGLRVHVAEAGSGDPLVLQHGWPQHWLIWRGLIPALADQYRVICPDLRGHGWTDAPPRGYEKEQFATDLLALLNALGLERVRMVGHDWGGFAGFLACLRAPERFERFCCLSIITPWLRPTFSPKALAASMYRPLISSPLLGRTIVRRTGFIRLLLQRGSAGASPWSEDVLASYTDQWKQRERAAASVQIYRRFVTRELWAILRGRYNDRRLTVPTLHLYGAKDLVITGDRLGAWREHADDMSVEELPGAAHFLPEEVPEAVLERLVPFLR
jgi:pimeloyl-ACP methyl ester carboxylesterase